MRCSRGGVPPRGGLQGCHLPAWRGHCCIASVAPAHVFVILRIVARLVPRDLWHAWIFPWSKCLHICLSATAVTWLPLDVQVTQFQFFCVFSSGMLSSVTPALHFHILVHIFTPKVRMCTRICTQIGASLGEFRRVFGEFRRVLASFWRVLASNRRVMGE